MRELSVARKEIARHKKLHLGCGRNIIDGWVNVDISGPIRWDPTKPFPVSSGIIRFIYSEHFIEHLSLDQAKGLFNECYRVLQLGGVLRVSTPNLRKIVEEYLSGRLSEWQDVGWAPSTPCLMMNEGMRLWGHQFVYDSEELKKMFEGCGFRKVTHMAWRESEHKELQGLESRPFHNEIILEGTK